MRIRILLSLLLLSGCDSFRPIEYDKHICRVVLANWGWRQALNEVSEEYGVSPGLVLSVIFHESSFNAQARPKSGYVLGLIPWQNSSAYGYGQIKSETWTWYLEKKPGLFRSRTNFTDTAYFIGWYYELFVDRSNAKDVAHDFYLAYHEGLGGYKRKTFQNNEWLLNKAAKVSQRAAHYDTQLKKCL
jgi:hypothetical protein